MLPEFIMMETFDKNWNKLKLTNEVQEAYVRFLRSNRLFGD